MKPSDWRLVRFPNPLAPDIQTHVSWGTRLLGACIKLLYKREQEKGTQFLTNTAEVTDMYVYQSRCSSQEKYYVQYALCIKCQIYRYININRYTSYIQASNIADDILVTEREKSFSVDEEPWYYDRYLIYQCIQEYEMTIYQCTNI